MISGEHEAFELVRAEGETEEELRESWLKIRRAGVGGSDVAAIMGLSPWRTAYEVWVEKLTGALEDISDKPAVHWGNRLEALVGDEYRKSHQDRIVRRVNAVARSIARPWAQASLDFEVKDPDLGWGVLEIKTAGYRSANHWDEGVPTFYLTQVTHYLSITGRPFADVAVLIGGQDYREYRIMRDADDVAAVDKAVDEFWHTNVEGGVEPEVTGTDGPSVFSMHPDPGDVVELGSTPLALSRYQLACVEYDAAKKERDRWGAKLKAEIGDAKGWQTPAGKVLWQRGQRSRFDSKRFKADHPDLNDEYTVTSQVDGGLRFYPAKEDR